MPVPAPEPAPKIKTITKKVKDPAQEAACKAAKDRAAKATAEAADAKSNAKAKVIKMETTIKQQDSTIKRLKEQITKDSGRYKQEKTTCETSRKKCTDDITAANLRVEEAKGA